MVFIPFATLIVGALFASFYTLKPSMRSSTQHFAAGVVFAAVAVELLPHLIGANPYLVAVGFLIGTFVMLLIKSLTRKLSSNSPAGLLSAVGVDITIDGLLIGIAFETGKRGGDLITIALAIEILFLGLATASSLKQKWGTLATIGTCIALAWLIPLGYFIGISVMHLLPEKTLIAVIAFGVSALLYLVTEELLMEAHEVEDTSLITSCFFLGFLLILLL